MFSECGSISTLSYNYEFLWWGVVPSDYLVSTQLQFWLFCCWGCSCCWALIVWNTFTKENIEQHRQKIRNRKLDNRHDYSKYPKVHFHHVEFPSSLFDMIRRSSELKTLLQLNPTFTPIYLFFSLEKKSLLNCVSLHQITISNKNKAHWLSSPRESFLIIKANIILIA